jgi:hypothetical protein
LPEVADRLDRDDDGGGRCDVGDDAGRWVDCPDRDRDHRQDHRDHHRDHHLDAEPREHRRDAGRNRPDDHRGTCSNQAADEPSLEAAE